MRTAWLTPQLWEASAKQSEMKSARGPQAHSGPEGHNIDLIFMRTAWLTPQLWEASAKQSEMKINNGSGRA